MEEHTDDIRNVEEGDSVTIITESKEFDATCASREVQRADPRTGEVRETKMWFFDAVEHQPAVSIIEGLRSSADDPDFPVHNEMWDRQQEMNMGYVKDVKIHGKMEA